MNNLKNSMMFRLPGDVFKNFLLFIISTLPLATIIIVLAEIRILAWIYLGFLSWICIWEYLRYNANNKRAIKEDKISFSFLTQVSFRQYKSAIFIVSSFTILNITATNNAITVRKEFGILIGTLATLGVLSNIIIQCGAFMGKITWNKSVILIWVGLTTGVIASCFKHYLIGAFLFTSPLFLFYIDSLLMVEKNMYTPYTEFSDYKERLLCKALPEEYINDLKTAKNRWFNQNLTALEIKRKTVICIIGMIWGLLVCKIENIILNKNKIE